jgi:hypothetical protein
MLCKYKNLFGEPKKGIHSYRFMNIAIVDVVQTVIGAFILSRLLNINFWITLVCFFILGIILHRLFCVKTTLDKFFFG